MSRFFRIHPAIGIARMGNSPEHFIGPETPGVPANWDDKEQKFKLFRDSKGRILRQGARFRVFEYTPTADGALSEPREVGLGEEIVDIEWRVHLANRKASFYVFDGQNGAEDLYQQRSKDTADKIIKQEPDRTNLRNANVFGTERAVRLEIDPSEQLISQAKPDSVEFSNSNKNIPIDSLGTLLLDEKGRLIVLGGYGQSNSIETPPRQIDEYASNDTWFDDASDGSVKARIRFRDGSFIDADPAWVMVGPPDFAPGIGNAVTLFDTLWDTAVREVNVSPATPFTPMFNKLREQKKIWQDNGGESLKGYEPSFLHDIYPMLKHALDARDVHDSGGSTNYHRMWFEDMSKLSEISESASKIRKAIFNYMRDPDSAKVEWDKMPRGHGDEYADPEDETLTARCFFSLTRIQYAMFREWTEGNFIADWPGNDPIFSAKSDPAPDDLDIAATENSVGGPFFPGIDVSWLIRVKELYSEPFRLKIPAQPTKEIGANPDKIGALQFQPGFFSQQMALPWQADFYDCHKERRENPENNKEYYFMWWTAHRPDDVFPSGKQDKERWVREFDQFASAGAQPDDLENLERFNQMQKRWHELKFIMVKSNGHYEEEP